MRLYEQMKAEFAKRAYSEQIDEINDGASFIRGVIKAQTVRDMQVTSNKDYRINNLGQALINKKLLLGLKIPLLYIVKDIVDTGKAYKTGKQIARDLLIQPFYGLGNTIRGVLGIIASPFYLLFKIIAIPFQNKYSAAQSFAAIGIFVASSLLDLFRGVTQIIAWPLTIARAPIRGIISALSGAPKLEDSKGLRKLVGEYEKASTPGSQRLIFLTFGLKLTLRDVPKRKPLEEIEEANPDDQKKFSPMLKPLSGVDAKEISEGSIESYTKVMRVYKGIFQNRDKELASPDVGVKCFRSA